MGYGPESVDLSEEVCSVRPTVCLRQPAEGVSISLTGSWSCVRLPVVVVSSWKVTPPSG